MPQPPKSKLTRKHLIASAIILALAFGFAGWGMNRSEEVDGTNVTNETNVDGDAVTAPPSFRHPLSGLSVLSNLSTLPRVYAVMVDNSVDAWPVSGVDSAFLVIEAPVEAAIPRLEAFFSSDASVGKIGPVRSARPYFVEWTSEFDALYVHVGGSNAALDLISSTGAFDLNEFYNAVSFWRSSDRSAPHNAYTSTDLLAAAVARAEERGRAPDALYGVWKFKDADVVGQVGQEGQEYANVSVRFNSDLYLAEWTFEAATGTYLRSQGGRAAKVSDGTRISASNVAVVVTDVSILDAVGRRKIRTIGEGKAWVFQDGKKIDAIWKKPSASERLAFYDAEGNELPMNAGNTWIEVVSEESDVTFP